MLRHVFSKAGFYQRNGFRRLFHRPIITRQIPAVRKNAHLRSRPDFWLSSQSCHYHSAPEASPVCVDDATIYALSTAPGRAGIAVIRISGASCLNIYKSLCPSLPVPAPRRASLRTLYSPRAPSDILDSALVLYFPAPRTVTGEEVLELHIHGGPATVKAVLAAIADARSQHPIRYAEPGEFTRRAFQNGRLDLAQVEALSDGLAAETEQQRRAAVRGNSGRLGRTYEEWREALLHARGELEALIDFSEDQHFDESPSELMGSVTAQVKVMRDEIAKHEEASVRGELVRRGVRISLLGPPNVGKSSLLNYIVGREASIVSQEAGTTRDIVEVALDIRGFLCLFADTAGLRTDAGEEKMIGKVEEEGMRRAKAKALESDVVIALGSVEKVGNGWTIRYDSEALAIAASTQESLVVINKCDDISSNDLHALVTDFKASTYSILPNVDPILISCKAAQSPNPSNTGGIHNLLNSLISIFQTMTSLPENEDLLGVTERQRQLLTSCSQHLHLFVSEALSPVHGESDIVLAAEHLRSAANCLSRITGRGEAGDVEEVLGVVFEK
ncbi:hypothetical protein B7494_g2427 [Chlorociboria aeruginascens]|nr:hypothetical protein B7494_g2427 [Chlorociboria aeruginascens]